MVSDKVFTTDGSSKIYSVDFHIISDNHCNVFVNNILQSKSIYDIINNAVVFESTPSAGQTLTIQVGTTPDDLLTTPTEAGIVASNITDVNTVAGIEADVTTVASISTNVTSVAADAADIGTVAGSIANVNATGGSIANVNTVATDIANVNTVAGVSTDVTTVAGVSTNVTTVATDIANVNTVAADLNEPVSEIETVAGSIANVDTVGGAIANVNTVATDITNVNTVAGISADVTAVAGNNANVTAVAGNEANINSAVANAANITTVANDLNEPVSEIDTVANSIANVDTVGADIANVNTTAGSIANVNTVAGSIANVNATGGAIANVNTVATDIANVNTAATNIANINTVATGIANINTVASDLNEVLSEVETVANDLNEATSEIDTVANSIANVDAVGTDIANVNTVATNINAVNSFADTYSIAATPPATPTAGDLWFDTSADTMKVYNGTSWQNAGSSVNGVENSVEHVATAGQTIFPATYDAGFIEVYLNGVRLDHSDYTATDGSNVVLNTGAALNDTVFIQAFGTFSLANAIVGNVTADLFKFTGGTGTQGEMSWNTDEETVDLVQNGTTLQLGQETQAHVRNNTASQINDGTVVYVTGSLGASGRVTVAPAGTTDAKYIVGVATEDIPAGEDGKVTNFGKVRGVDTSTWADGTILYVNTADGSLTSTAPTTGLKMPIAFVINSHAINGTLMVRATPINELFVEHGETAYGWGDHGAAGYAAGVHTHAIAEVSGLQTALDGKEPADATIVKDADIGVTVQGYDADTAKTDVAQTFTATQSFGDNVKAQFGASDDLQIYHDGSNSYIEEAGTGNLFIRSHDRLYLGNYATGENHLIAIANGTTQLYYDNAQKLATTSTGVDVTGTVTADGLTLGDNAKAQFGAGNDLQIYHDGSSSYLDDAGTGNLNLRSNGAGVIIADTSNTVLARFLNGNACDFNFNGSTKLATTSTGIDVTGTVGATTVDLGNWTITESAGVLYFATSGTNKMKLDASGNLTVTGNVTGYGTV